MHAYLSEAVFVEVSLSSWCGLRMQVDVSSYVIDYLRIEELQWKSS